MMRVIVIFLVGCVLMSLVSSAQVAKPGRAKEEKKETAKAYVTVIALGAVPRKRYEIRKRGMKGEGMEVEVEEGAEAILEEGLPVLLPPREGESPPAALYFRSREDAKIYDRIRVGFNNPASINELKPGVEHGLYRRDEESGEDYESYFTLPALAANSQTLIFLTQGNRRSNRWLKRPVVSGVNMNAEGLREAKLNMKNLSSERVYLKVGDGDQVVLKAGESYVYKGEGKGMLRVLAGKGRGGRVSLVRTGVRLPEGNLTTFAFYDADPATNSGKSVGVCRVVTTRLVLPDPER